MVMIINKRQLFPLQRGLGIKYRKPLNGDGIWTSVRKYGIPTVRYLYNYILKPFWKNNREYILNTALSGINSLNPKASNTETLKHLNETVVKPVIENIKEKPLYHHLKGEGVKINKKSSEILRRLLES